MGWEGGRGRSETTWLRTSEASGWCRGGGEKEVRGLELGRSLSKV